MIIEKVDRCKIYLLTEKEYSTLIKLLDKCYTESTVDRDKFKEEFENMFGCKYVECIAYSKYDELFDGILDNNSINYKEIKMFFNSYNANANTDNKYVKEAFKCYQHDNLSHSTLSTYLQCVISHILIKNKINLIECPNVAFFSNKFKLKDRDKNYETSIV